MKNVTTEIVEFIEQIAHRQKTDFVKWGKPLQDKRSELSECVQKADGAKSALRDASSNLSPADFCKSYDDVKKKASDVQKRAGYYSTVSFEYVPPRVDLCSITEEMLTSRISTILPSVSTPQLIEAFPVEDVGLIAINGKSLFVGAKSTILHYTLATGTLISKYSLPGAIWDLCVTDAKIMFALADSVGCFTTKSSKDRPNMVVEGYGKVVKVVASDSGLVAIKTGENGSSIVKLNPKRELTGTINYYQGKYAPKVATSSEFVAVGCYDHKGVVHDLRVFDSKLTPVCKCEHWVKNAAFLGAMKFLNNSVLLTIAMESEGTPNARLYRVESCELVSQRLMRLGDRAQIRSADYDTATDNFVFCCTDKRIRRLKPAS